MKPSSQIRKLMLGAPLVVQRLRLCTSNEGGTGSIPGRGTRIPHAKWHGKKKKKEGRKRKLMPRQTPRGVNPVAKSGQPG